MIPVVGMFRGLFLGSVLVWYSSSVWKTMDNYYNQEFKKYLQKEKQERRFPSGEEVCRTLPEAPCAAAATAAADQRAAAHDAVANAGGGGGGGDGEALGANAATESGGDGGGSGCTVSRDATHTGEWRRRAGEVGSSAAPEHAKDDEDTCAALY